jgi:S-adenosylmethionine:tRNA ribosyltransferase-isomerase
VNIDRLNLEDYNYNLPEDRIAQHPVAKRDMSKLLVCNPSGISKDTFRNIDDHLPAESLLVFNNTRVIRARLLFRKETGASVEILCIEPLSPSVYEASLGSKEDVEWKCIIGNLRKWKTGKIKTEFIHKNKPYVLIAEKVQTEGDAWRIRFGWNCTSLTFGEVIDACGHIPLPPYINREDDDEDNKRYQTVYSRVKGSVAAPTAGLHFTEHVLDNLRKKGIKLAEVTLHVGAGTFKPIKTKNILEHEMHCEHFYFSAGTIEDLIENHGRIIAVGTTSVRTLESIYLLGSKLINNPAARNYELSLGQWEAYNMDSAATVREALEELLNLMKEKNVTGLNASTSIMIVPGYKFRMIEGLITNFHQPDSSLLLLISAWIGEKWKEVYRYALENDFRFLSYGDSSLLTKKEPEKAKIK